MRARLLIVLDDLVKIFKPRNAVLLLAQALRRDQTQVLAPQAELADAARERLTADLEQFFRLRSGELGRTRLHFRSLAACLALLRHSHGHRAW